MRRAEAACAQAGAMALRGLNRKTEFRGIKWLSGN
jgi:hypothetical protein